MSRLEALLNRTKAKLLDNQEQKRAEQKAAVTRARKLWSSEDMVLARKVAFLADYRGLMEHYGITVTTCTDHTHCMHLAAHDAEDMLEVAKFEYGWYSQALDAELS